VATFPTTEGVSREGQYENRSTPSLAPGRRPEENDRETQIQLLRGVNRKLTSMNNYNMKTGPLLFAFLFYKAA